MVTTIYTTSLAPLSYSTASVSLPIPLSAANRLSRSTTSVSNGSPKWSWQWNLRRTVQSRPQLKPAVALSVVPTVFGYMLIPSSWYNTFFRHEIGGSRLLGNARLFVLIYMSSNLGRREFPFRITLRPWTPRLAEPVLSCNLPWKSLPT